MNNKKNIKIVKTILKVITGCLFVLCILFGLSWLLWEGLIYENKMRYTPSGRIYKKYEKLDKNHLYVVTENEYNGDISYYKVDKKLRLSEANKFDYEPLKALNISDCFKFYAYKRKNKLNKKNCEIRDSENNKVNSNKDLDNIIKIVPTLHHAIAGAEVIPINGDYYVVTLFIVNFRSPYTLYKYENNTLKTIYEFDGENIIALKTINDKKRMWLWNVYSWIKILKCYFLNIMKF